VTALEQENARLKREVEDLKMSQKKLTLQLESAKQTITHFERKNQMLERRCKRIQEEAKLEHDIARIKCKQERAKP